GTDVFAGMAQIAASSQSAVRQMPPGTVPPYMIAYSAADVPILQIGFSSKSLSEQQLQDLTSNFIRTQLATVQGAELPGVYGGKNRLITVDLNPQKLLERSISGADVVSAVNAQNLVVPQGTTKIGSREYDVALNSSAKTVDELNDVPIRVINGAMVYLRDVAFVHDGNSFQTNISRTDGQRGVLQTVLKHGRSSTLDVVARVRAALPKIAATLPPELEMKPIGDQSVFVRAAVTSVLREAIIAACLTATLILLFLGSWRSTLVVSVSIPLAILTSVLVMSALGETINIMTLGGLALAVGILVDDATVEIENINRLLPEGRPLRETILTGAQQIAMPAFVATLAICVVFVPIFFLSGVPGFLFRPLAEAVVFAMLASYFLSRTIVPTLVMYFFLAERKRDAARAEKGHQPGVFRRFHLAFEEGFEHARDRYLAWLEWCLAHRVLVTTVFLGFCAGTMALIPLLGTDLFPTVDAGQIRLHVRAPTGTRVEETAALCDRVEKSLRRQIAESDLAGISDNIGFPNSGINVTLGNSGVIGTEDAEVLISLTPEHRTTPADYIRGFRQSLPREFPGNEFYFQPADIVSQVLNFGLPAPIDIQLTGPNVAQSYDLARKVLPKLEAVPGAVDVHIQQGYDQPTLNITVDRTKAQEVGMTQTVVANNEEVALSNSFTTAPNFWVSPQGVTYSVATQTPQYRMDSYSALQGMPVINTGANPQAQLLNNIATISRSAAPDVASQYDIQRVVDIYATAQDRDLGGVSGDISRVMDSFAGQLPRGTTVNIRGQVETMRDSFRGLAIGLIFSVLLVYLLMVVNFQSWADPFVIITALPGALAGIVWMLFFTGTTLNVPSLMGAIMCIGVATSNSILLVNFASTEMKDGKNSMAAAASAGFTRLRPVIMTALAMIVGMIPMALGIGEGAEQNAPLGRAVIGGLLLATFATLFFVPVVFSFVRRKGYAEMFREE
ncbi:MAG TPA: efflux RND transporter permease subunit, partial [Vicinamibacterales bacterium]|nr:efflux RND transporter permease subunit [Vicinamibacterales bacterium]